MTWAQVCALATQALDFLKTVWPAFQSLLTALWAARNQKKLDTGNEAEVTLQAVARADEVAAAVDGMSDADVLRDLQSRGRVRDL